MDTNKNLTKRILAILLSAFIFITYMPGLAYAAQDTQSGDDSVAEIVQGESTDPSEDVDETMQGESADPSEDVAKTVTGGEAAEPEEDIPQAGEPADETEQAEEQGEPVSGDDEEETESRNAAVTSIDYILSDGSNALTINEYEINDNEYNYYPDYGDKLVVSTSDGSKTYIFKEDYELFMSADEDVITLNDVTFEQIRYDINNDEITWTAGGPYHIEVNYTYDDGTTTTTAKTNIEVYVQASNVSGITFVPKATSITLYKGVDGWTENGNFYFDVRDVYDYLYGFGNDKLTIQYLDGTSDSVSLDELSNWEYVTKASNNEYVPLFEAQEEDPWTIGKSYEVFLKAMGSIDTDHPITVTIQKSPVTGFSFEQSTKYLYVFNGGGEEQDIEYDASSDEYYLGDGSYNGYAGAEGDVLTFEYEDGTKKVFKYGRIENDPDYPHGWDGFVTDDGNGNKSRLEREITFDTTGQRWKPDGDGHGHYYNNTVELNYMGALSNEKLKSYVGYQVWFYDEYDENEGEYITHANSCTPIGMSFNESGVDIFEPERDGYTLVGWYEMDQNGKLYDEPYNFDEPVTKETFLYAKWTEDDEPGGPEVEDFSFTPAEPITYIAHTKGSVVSEGYDDPETGEYVGEHEYFRYYTDILFNEGDTIRVNGTEYTYRQNDEGTYGYYSDEDEMFDPEDIDISDDQSYENQWTPENGGKITLTYGGKSCDIPVTITETPVASFEFRQGNKYLYVFDAGEGAEVVYDNDDDKYYIDSSECGYAGSEGDSFTVTYKDGSVFEYEYGRIEDDPAFPYGWDGFVTTVNGRKVRLDGEITFDPRNMTWEKDADGHYTNNDMVLKYMGVPNSSSDPVVSYVGYQVWFYDEYDENEGEYITHANSCTPIGMSFNESGVDIFEPERDGYTLVGWYEMDSNGNLENTPYDFDSKVYAETYLYAKWAAAEEHTHELVKVDAKAASCTEDGNTEYWFCSGCEKYFSDAEGDNEIANNSWVIEALGHLEALQPVTENVVDATCVEEGSYDEVVYCTRCGEELSRETKTLEKIQHTAGEAVRENVVDPTYTKEGSYDEVVYCTVCGQELHRESRTIDALTVEKTGADVSFADDISEEDKEAVSNVTASVQDENLVEAAKAVADEVEVTAADGLEALQSEGLAGDASAENISIVIQTYLDMEIQTVNREEGSDEIKSVTIEITPKVSVIAALDETNIEIGTNAVVVEEKPITVSKATIVEIRLPEAFADSNVVYVLHNGEEYEASPKDGESATFVFTTNGFSPFVFSKEHTHKLTAHAGKAPTCETAGNIEYWSCSSCGKYFSDAEGTTEIQSGSWVIPATGHTPGEKVTENNVDPTCTVSGRYDEVAYCSVCHEELSRETVTVPTLDHDLELIPPKAPTTTAAGNTAYYKCKSCGKYFSDATGQEEIAKNSWIIPATGEDKTPPAVTSLDTTIKGTTSCIVTWTGNRTAKNYRLAYKLTGGSYKYINVGSATRYTVTGLSAGKTYVFAVAAQDKSGKWSKYYYDSSWSYRFIGTVSPKATAKSGKVTIKWTKLKAATGYQVRYGYAGGSRYTKSTTGASKTISAGSKGKTVVYQVRPYKTVSGKKYLGAWSGQKSIKAK